MNRRGFLRGLLGAAAAVSTVSYFDMGASWQKHDSGIWIVADPLAPPNTGYIIDAKPMSDFLKKHYNDKTVSSLIFGDRTFLANIQSAMRAAS